MPAIKSEYVNGMSPVAVARRVFVESVDALPQLIVVTIAIVSTTNRPGNGSRTGRVVRTASGY